MPNSSLMVVEAFGGCCAIFWLLPHEMQILPHEMQLLHLLGLGDCNLEGSPDCKSRNSTEVSLAAHCFISSDPFSLLRWKSTVVILSTLDPTHCALVGCSIE